MQTAAKWFDERGFDFITPADGGRDVFVHVSAFHRAGLGEPECGEWFSFEVEMDSNSGKTRAADLRKLNQKAAEVEAAYATR